MQVLHDGRRGLACHHRRHYECVEHQKGSEADAHRAKQQHVENAAEEFERDNGQLEVLLRERQNEDVRVQVARDRWLACTEHARVRVQHVHDLGRDGAEHVEDRRERRVARAQTERLEPALQRFLGRWHHGHDGILAQPCAARLVERRV